MRSIVILCVLVLSGCEGVTNGAEIKAMYENCTARFQSCTVVAIPDDWDIESWIAANLEERDEQ